MTGLGGGAAGIDPERVAEVLVELAGHGPGRRGSGYRISAEAVLTAAHVVRDADAVRVRFDADRSGEWVAEGRVAWSDPGVDVAVVTITPRPEDTGRVEPVGFGRVAERDAVLECSAMGFPLFKLRDDPAPAGGGTPSRYRDSVHAVGTIAVLSNRREGTLEVSVAAPERDPDPNLSPWGGMSGAAVWSAGRVIGLIAEHHRSDGLGRLAATRVDRWHERLSPAQLHQLCGLTGLPAKLGDLREVVPPIGSELVEAGYQAQVRDIAPWELRGREAELAELVRFCAGDAPYQWWLADAWAGKSALAAWFVLHPPAGVRVASFFVTRRLAGQADSDAFTEEMVEQLAVIADEPTAQATTPSGRDRERIRLLELAARRVGEGQERLLLVVDGLDEDEGARPASGKPSIASLLPRRPAGNVRVLVTSRPHPGIPDDVPGGHPLRHCVPRQLDPSPFAHHIEVAAKNELMEQLHGDQLQVDILGYVTASGGGLAIPDLAELTGSPEWALDGKLRTVFGRSLMTRAQRGPVPAGPDDVVYLFAHETLGAVAEETLGNDLGPYRQRLHGWADGYRERGWPADTPQYLLRPYWTLLADKGKGDLRRLADLATDPGRHDRLLAATLGDGDAIAEIATVQERALEQPVPDLAILGRLAVHRDRLEGRNEHLPVELPALLVRVGQRRRGEAIAKSMPMHAQPKALAGVAGALADAGRWERAERTAREITATDSKARALAWVGRAMMEADRERAVHLLEEAGQTAESVPESYLRPFAIAAVAEAFADAGLWERAEETAHAIEPIYAAAGARALRLVVDALVADGRWDRAERTAKAVPSIWDKAAAQAAVAAAIAGHDRERALALLQQVEGTARGHYPSASDAEPLGVILAACSEVDPDRAAVLATAVEQAAHRIPHPVGKASALTAIALALAAVHRWDEAERVAGDIARPDYRADTTRALAEALATAGDRARAERAARGIPAPKARAEALLAVATTLGAEDQGEALALANAAEQTARDIPHAGRVWALQAVARAQATAGQWDQAERTARRITDQDSVAQVEALGHLAEAMAEADRERAATLAADARRIAHGITGGERDRAAEAVARALAAAGQLDDAEEVARGITDPDRQREALEVLARTMGTVDRPRALALAAEAEQDVRARMSAEPLSQAVGLGGLAKLLAEIDPDRAVDLAAEAERAGSAAGPDERDDTLAAVAEALAAVGQWDRAERAARGIVDPETQVRALAEVAGALVAVDLDRALAVAAQAEGTARTFPNLYERARAWVVIVERLTAAAPLHPAADDPLHQRLHRLLAEILAGGRWLDALEPLGRLDPAALAAVDRELNA